MASRPVFLPVYTPRLVEERIFEFSWSPGYSITQKQKNIASLHKEARRHGIERILEISSKSDKKIGQRLSAFSLQLEVGSRKYPLESIYQGSKVFEHGGPFIHLFELTPRQSKQYIKSQDFGSLKAFQLENKTYPLSPMNAFYDWLYIRTLVKYTEWIEENVKYDAFTDIEFNPSKQVNCQARAFAEYLSLLKQEKLEDAAGDFHFFANMMKSI